jgi:hypothetical protein
LNERKNVLATKKDEKKINKNRKGQKPCRKKKFKNQHDGKKEDNNNNNKK